MGHQLPRRVCHPRALPGAGRVRAGRALLEAGGAGPPRRTEHKPASLGWGGLGRSCHLSPHRSCPPYVETPRAGIHASQRGRPARSQWPSKAPVHKIRFVWRRILPGPRRRVAGAQVMLLPGSRVGAVPGAQASRRGGLCPSWPGGVLLRRQLSARLGHEAATRAAPLLCSALTSGGLLQVTGAHGGSRALPHWAPALVSRGLGCFTFSAPVCQAGSASLVTQLGGARLTLSVRVYLHVCCWYVQPLRHVSASLCGSTASPGHSP